MIRSVAVVIGALVAMAASLSAGAQDAIAKPNSWKCQVPPVESCFTHRGRLSTQNGIAYMLWLVGTRRIVNVTETEIPTMLSQYLDMTSPDHADIFGDFEICPLEVDTPGRMRMACLASAKRLVVQDRERTRPPILVPSTWAR